MTEEDAFVAAILASPCDDTLRLVFADWLEEQGDARGELLRVATVLEALEASEPPTDMKGRLSRVRQIGRLTRRWRELIRPEHWFWLASLHRGPLLCGGLADGECPGRWDRLPPEPGQPFVRYCGTCTRWVRLCWTSQEAERVRRSGRVVALAVVVA
ncbi:MAG TPA: TIGR02996 domain-containing protein [Gemmataceae bacterium]|nr:TIGR02996 domain-containing protein [Gemmataceae bacterium]